MCHIGHSRSESAVNAHPRRAFFVSAGITGILLVLLLGSCGSNSRSSSNSEEEDQNIFRLNLSAPVSSLDPAFADNQANTWAAVQLYNGLLRLRDDGTLEADLASSWTGSSDGMVYTFHLRRDVWFHPDPAFADPTGRRMTADDVVYSFRRLLDPVLGADGFWVFNGVFDPEKGIVALNDSVLEIRLNQPFEPFLSRLSMPYCSVVAREAVERYGAGFRQHPVGTGPFRLSRWEEGEKLLLVRNERYFRQDERGQKLPYLDGVQFTFLSAKGTEFLQFRNGALDFVSDLDAAFLDEVLDGDGELQKAYSGQMVLHRGPYLNTEYLGINLEAVQGNVLGDVRIRQALNYGTDRERMIAFQRKGKGRPALGGMVPAALWSKGLGATYGYPFDPEKAAALLAQAGYPGGRNMPPITLRTNDQYLDLCVFLQAQWQELGIPVQVENMDGKILRETMVQGQTAFFRASWIADYPDPESYLALFYSAYDAPPNYTRFQSKAFDQWYEAAVRETDQSRRMQLYRQMDSLVMTVAPVIPLYYDEVLVLTSPKVEGLSINPMNLLRLEAVRKGNPLLPG